MPKVCSVAGCDRPSRTRGYCGTHYQRFQAHGDPLWTPPAPESRWWSYVDKRGVDDCWPWIGATAHYGHGRFWNGSNQIPAHRYSYELLIGPIPDGFNINHHCDNPPCCNPKHLYAGTQLDNMQDKVRRGRANFTGPINPAKGEHNGNVTLTRAEVDELRSLEGTTTISALARRFGIGRTQVYRILRRESWRE